MPPNNNKDVKLASMKQDLDIVTTDYIWPLDSIDKNGHPFLVEDVASEGLGEVYYREYSTLQPVRGRGQKALLQHQTRIRHLGLLRERVVMETPDTSGYSVKKYLRILKLKSVHSSIINNIFLFMTFFPSPPSSPNEKVSFKVVFSFESFLLVRTTGVDLASKRLGPDGDC